MNYKLVLVSVVLGVILAVGSCWLMMEFPKHNPAQCAVGP